MRRHITWKNLPIAVGAVLLVGWVALTATQGWGWWGGWYGR